jgi:excisionase family DNA binding protein
MQAVTITQISPPELQQIIESSIAKILGSTRTTAPQPEADQLFTIQQAADFLTLSVPTLYNLVSRKEIPYMKKGKRLYFSKEELTSWLRSGRKQTMAEIQTEADAYLLTKKKRG